jgi:DNA primase
LTPAEFGVGFYVGPGPQSGCIVIQIHYPRGEIVAYAGRSLDDSLPKYKLPVRFRKAVELFNLHRAAVTGSKAAIVVDCPRFHQADVHGAWPDWMSVSAEKEYALLQRFDQVVLMLDGDAAGRACDPSHHGQIVGECPIAVVPATDGTQPDQLSFTAIRALLGEEELRQRDSVNA